MTGVLLWGCVVASVVWEIRFEVVVSRERLRSNKRRADKQNRMLR